MTLRVQVGPRAADVKGMILVYECSACGRGVALGTLPGRPFDREIACSCGAKAELHRMTALRRDVIDRPTLRPNRRSE